MLLIIPLDFFPRPPLLWAPGPAYLLGCSKAPLQARYEQYNKFSLNHYRYNLDCYINYMPLHCLFLIYLFLLEVPLIFYHSLESTMLHVITFHTSHLSSILSSQREQWAHSHSLILIDF